jgi:hypothetical protein
VYRLGKRRGRPEAQAELEARQAEAVFHAPRTAGDEAGEFKRLQEAEGGRRLEAHMLGDVSEAYGAGIRDEGEYPHRSIDGLDVALFLLRAGHRHPLIRQ